MPRSARGVQRSRLPAGFKLTHYRQLQRLVRQRRRRYTVGMLEFTAVYKKVAEGYVAYVEELPGANTQGDTLDEARENLKEAVELVLESNRALAREDAGNDDLIREPLRLATG
jgi:predicted RNase H-like HicB family nuclease